MTRLMAALGLSLLLPFAVRAEDWPQWRGPNRDGVWNETGILETFPTNGLAVRWRAPVGYGFSSPVVAEGRVYVTDSQLERPKVRERVLCFDEASGKSLWTYSHQASFPDWAFNSRPGAGSERDTDCPGWQGVCLGSARSPSVLPGDSQGRPALEEESGEGISD